jgi:signal transduction histidine kinase
MTLRLLVPESLLGRLLMGLLVSVGVALVTIVGLFLREWNEVLSQDTEMTTLVTHIASSIDRFAHLNPEQRVAALEQRQGRLGNFSGGLRELTVAEVSDAARSMQAGLERALGNDYVVAVKPFRSGLPMSVGYGDNIPILPSAVPARVDGPLSEVPRQLLLYMLDVAVTYPGGPEVRVFVEVPEAPSRLPVALSLQLFAVTLSLGIVLYAIARTVTRPLRRLESAAEAVGKGVRFAPLPESGVRELRNATRAFNAMQERLYRFLDGRTRGLLALSHDLRTPLTRLKLRAESLEDQSLRERFHSDLDAMDRMVAGALRLFKATDAEGTFESVGIEELLAELRREFGELSFDVAISGRANGLVNARRDGLKRCLENLISNAVKYGERADVIVADDAGDVVVRVQDEGPGIPEPMLEKVFEPFFRLESSRNAETGGMGLGLSIARDAAQAHGGSLVLRNRAPRGLEAILRLPKLQTH